MHIRAESQQLADAARRLLDTELEQPIGASIDALRRSGEEYRSIGEKRLGDQMRKNITLTLLRISGDEIPAELATAAFETGQLRAIQQIDLNAVSRAFRIDLRVLWEAFLRDAATQGHENDTAYISELLRVWEAVESNINEMTEGYRGTAEKLKRQNTEAKSAAFQRLLDLGAGAGASAVAKQLLLLGFDPAERLFSIVSDLRESDYDELSAVQARLEHRGIANYFGWQSQYLIGLIQGPDVSTERFAELLPELGEFRTGIAGVQAPAEVPAALRNARVLAAAVNAPGLRTLRDDWLAAISHAEPRITDALVEEIFAPFEELSDYSREELSRVIEGYFSTNGTIAAISKLLFRHRNTVRNRLAQVEELTGLRLGVPRDTALLAVAFAAWRRNGVRR